jgi:hypothetical protein
MVFTTIWTFLTMGPLVVASFGEATRLTAAKSTILRISAETFRARWADFQEM